MNKTNYRLSRLKSFSILILIILFTISNTYPGPRFQWFGSENRSHQTARIYMKNGTMLSGLIKMGRKKNTRKKPAIASTSNEDQETMQKLKYFTLLNLEGRKIHPLETDSIIINSLTGIPYDTLWLFKIIEGKITLYNTKPLWRSNEFTHIQKDGSEIARYSRDLLKEYLKDNEYAFSLFTSLRYKDGRSKVLKENHPRRAILEYNFQTYTKRKKVNELLSKLEEGIALEKKISYCKEILAIDSSFIEPYLLLGDYAVRENNTEKAYFYYTCYLRYCESVVKIRDVREKIKKLQKTPVY